MIDHSFVNCLADRQEDRRAQRRYPLHLPLNYKLLRLGSVQSEGSGYTVNMASGGVLIETTSLVAVPLGSTIELAIIWPVLLDGECGLKLALQGRVVRSSGRRIAIQAHQYEFRTRRNDAVGMLAVSA